MSRKAKPNYILLWEMVYSNPNKVKHTPARLLVKVDMDSEIYNAGEFDHWIEEHRNQIAQCVIKAIKNNVSKYRCIKVFKVPFYSDQVA